MERRGRRLHLLRPPLRVARGNKGGGQGVPACVCLTGKGASPGDDLGDTSNGNKGDITDAGRIRRQVSTGKPDRRDDSSGGIPPLTYRLFMGGAAMAASILMRELRPGVDPLGPENIMVFATCPLTGIPLSGTTRFSVAAKSPLTDGYGEGEAGGYWGAGAEIRRLRRHHRDRPGAQASVSLDHGWQDRTPGCRPPLGQALGGRAGSPDGRDRQARASSSAASPASAAT